MLIYYSKIADFVGALQWVTENNESIVMLSECDLNELLYHLGKHMNNQDMETLFKLLLDEGIIDLSQWDIIGRFTNSITEDTLSYLLSKGVSNMTFYGWIYSVLQRVYPVNNFLTNPGWFNERLKFWVRMGIWKQPDVMIEVLERALRYRTTQTLIYKLVDIFGDIIHYSDDHYLLLCVRANVELPLIRWLIDEKGMNIGAQKGNIILHAISYAEPKVVEFLLSRVNWEECMIRDRCREKAYQRNCRKIIRMVTPP